MELKDLKKFGVFMSVLQETFSPDKPISDKKTEIYFEILSDIPIENIELGIKDLMKTKKYPIFPLPKEIREASGYMESDDLELKALEAFRDACDFAYKYGQLETKEIHENPLVEETIRLCFGGWVYFQDTDPKNETWDRKNFVEVYIKLFQVNKRDKLLSEAEILKQLKENRENMKTLEEKKEKKE